MIGHQSPFKCPVTLHPSVSTIAAEMPPIRQPATRFKCARSAPDLSAMWTGFFARPLGWA